MIFPLCLGLNYYCKVSKGFMNEIPKDAPQDNKIRLNAFLCCRDVLVNRRNDKVITIVNVFNELRVNKFPANLGSLCLVSAYSGAAGEYTHHFEIWSRGMQIGKSDPAHFFLENSISMYHVVTFLDGVVCEEPQQLTLRSILNGVEMGRIGLGIFKPFSIEEPPKEPGLEWNDQ